MTGQSHIAKAEVNHLTWRRGKQSLTYASGERSTSQSGKRNTVPLTDGDSVDHDGHLGDAPAHDNCANAQVVLERAAEGNKSDDVDDDGKIACPGYSMNQAERRTSGSSARNVPETALSLEDTLVAANGPVHDPIVEVTTNSLADEDGDLMPQVRRTINEGRNAEYIQQAWRRHQRWRRG